MTVRILVGDVREKLATLPDESVHCVVTSPPYFGLRDYNVAGQIGLEPTLSEYISAMVAVFREVRRVMRDDGVCWLNIGDSYYSTIATQGRNESKSAATSTLGPNRCGVPGDWQDDQRGTTYRRKDATLKPKDLMMVPARLAIALQDDGWWLRSDIIWAKPNPMPESVQDRPTSAHEHIFLLTKSARYFYDADAVKTEAKSPTTKMPDGWDTGEGAHGSFHRNGREKGERTDKQRGHGRRHDGFNDRWDAMSKDEQQANGVNMRNVWTIATHPFSGWTKSSRQIPVSQDEADDDTMRTPSPDCPVHVWTGRSDPSRVGDEREADSLNRISYSGDHRASAQSIDSAPIDQNHGGETPGENWDSLPLLCSATATTHSSQTSRMDLDPVTTQPYTPCVETISRIDDTSSQPASAAPHHDRPASNTAMADSGDHPLPGTADDTARMSSASRSSSACTCSYHKTVTESISHFATFPPEIPRRCIKAGCPADGVVLDPFGGSGTVGLVADELGRDAILVELNPVYAQMAHDRIHGASPMFADVILEAA